MIRLLAQDTVAVGDVLAYFSERLLTPLGISMFVLGLGTVGVLLAVRKGLPVLVWATLFSLTFMIHESTLTQNVLIGPLHAFRALTRPISFALMSLAILAVIGIPRPDRGGAIGFSSVALYAFQLLYAVQLMLFVEPLKGFLALASMTLMLLVCGVGFGKSMQDVQSTIRVLSVFFWVAVAFVSINLLQLTIGGSAALVSGRFVGISGNANQAGAICAVLMLCCAYFFNEPLSSRFQRFAAVFLLGVLGLLLAWTGSRASALAGVVGILAMYRLRLGRLALAGILVSGIVVIGFSLVAEDTSAASRLLSTENTRAGVWGQAWSDWTSSPIFGIMPLGEESGVESVPLRALASMGILGGVFFLIPVLSILTSLPRALWVGRARPELRALSDLYVGAMSCMLTTFLFEGYLFGVLTFFVMFTYVMLSLGHFLDDAYRVERWGSAGAPAADEDTSLGLPAL